MRGESYPLRARRSSAMLTVKLKPANLYFASWQPAPPANTPLEAQPVQVLGIPLPLLKYLHSQIQVHRCAE
jgi:hypothetical protein